MPYLAEGFFFYSRSFSPNFMPYLADGFSFNFSSSFLQNLHQYLAEGSSFFSRSLFSKFSAEVFLEEFCVLLTDLFFFRESFLKEHIHNKIA